MSKFMSFETFKECYIHAIASGVDMLCCSWNDEGMQVNMNWKPYTRDTHDQVKYEAEEIVEEKGITEDDENYKEELDAAIDEIVESYKKELDESAKEAYREYLGEDDEGDFEFSERFGEWNMKKITMNDIKKMWLNAPEKESVIEFYCYKNGLESDKIREDDKKKIYAELYPISSFLRDYCETIFYYGGCEPDEEVKELYEQILMDELI